MPWPLSCDLTWLVIVAFARGVVERRARSVASLWQHQGGAGGERVGYRIAADPCLCEAIGLSPQWFFPAAIRVLCISHPEAGVLQNYYEKV